MTMKHTPGPWTMKFTGDRKAILIDGKTALGNHIAEVDYDDVELAEQRANACLINTSPDLLEACEAAIRYDNAIRSCANNPDKMATYCTAQGDSLDTLYLDWISKARSALEKCQLEKCQKFPR